MKNGLRRLDRFQRVSRESVACGIKKWATLRMRDQNPRFDEAWSAAKVIPGWFEEVNATAMFKVLAEVRPRRVVEIGSFMGRSTVFFASSLQALDIDGRVAAIDPHSGDRMQRESLGMVSIPSFDMFRTYVRASGVEEIIDPIVATSSEAAIDWTEPFQFLFVDGWHGYEAVLADGREWAANIAPDGVIVFDDAIAYEEVRRAVLKLDREGTIHLWGYFFGQAYAGRTSTPPPCVKSLLALSRTDRFARKLNDLLPEEVRKV